MTLNEIKEFLNNGDEYMAFGLMTEDQFEQLVEEGLISSDDFSYWTTMQEEVRILMAEAQY
jgi:hypothetical protein